MLSIELPGSSADKESACSAEDPSSIPGLVRSAGEGIGYPLHFPWISLVTQASLITQLLKNLYAIQETPVQVLGWEDPLEKG